MNAEILTGDVLAKLAGLPSNFVDCVVTSPPYFGLRDYNNPPSVWGGETDCRHEWGATVPGSSRGGSGTPNGRNGTGEGYGRDSARGEFCLRCGAWRGCFGLEPTPALFVENAVRIFREVRRVLKPSGTCWLNLGDSYFGDSPTRKKGSEAFSESWDPSQTASRGGKRRSAASVDGLRAKCLCMMPARVAIALMEDGWYLRSEVIWAKPNPMPESVRDRPTRAHEQVFLLTKSPKYWYDADAIAEPVTPSTVERLSQPNYEQQEGSDRANAGAKTNGNMKAVVKKQDGHGRRHAGFNERYFGQNKRYIDQDGDVFNTRNARTVWTIATAPFSEAHFATFPPEIPKRCILAGCPEGGTVLDPFAGSGTTLMVAVQLGRKALGFEINPAYAEMAERRIASVTPSLFSEAG